MRRLAQVLFASAILGALWAPAAPAQSPADRLPPEIADKLPPGMAEKLAKSREAADAAAADARRAAESHVEGPARTLFVDKDRVQCPHAEFQSIQEAVAAAPPESTIMVCPDLYTEDECSAPARPARGGRPESGAEAREALRQFRFSRA